MPDVVVIDDNKKISSLISRYLKKKKISSAYALSGERAVGMLSEWAGKGKLPIICILDVMMPGLSGHKLMKEIKKIVPEMRFMLITGYTGIHEIEEMTKEGIVEVFYKPFRMDELVAKVNFVFANTKRMLNL